MQSTLSTILPAGMIGMCLLFSGRVQAQTIPGKVANEWPASLAKYERYNDHLKAELLKTPLIGLSVAGSAAFMGFTTGELLEHRALDLQNINDPFLGALAGTFIGAGFYSLILSKRRVKLKKNLAVIQLIREVYYGSGPQLNQLVTRINRKRSARERITHEELARLIRKLDQQGSLVNGDLVRRKYRRKALVEYKNFLLHATIKDIKRYCEQPGIF
mgnify:FL=1